MMFEGMIPGFTKDLVSITGTGNLRKVGRLNRVAVNQGYFRHDAEIRNKSGKRDLFHFLT